MFNTNNIVVGVAGISLISLIGTGAAKPELFESQGYASLTSLIAGGLLGVVSTSSKDDSIFK
jgi:hypothetical protein